MVKKKENSTYDKQWSAALLAIVAIVAIVSVIALIGNMGNTAISNTEPTSADLTGQAFVEQSLYGNDNDDNTVYVYRIYKVLLGRQPDCNGLYHWLNVAGNNRYQAFSGLMNSQEYTNNNLSNTQYVTRLYNVLLDRNPDTNGLNHWVGKLDRGAHRYTIYNSFKNSNEYKNHIVKQTEDVTCDWGNTPQWSGPAITSVNYGNITNSAQLLQYVKQQFPSGFNMSTYNIRTYNNRVVVEELTVDTQRAHFYGARRLFWITTPRYNGVQQIAWMSSTNKEAYFEPSIPDKYQTALGMYPNLLR